jgi:hypothetical protein
MIYTPTNSLFLAWRSGTRRQIVSPGVLLLLINRFTSSMTFFTDKQSILIVPITLQRDLVAQYQVEGNTSAIEKSTIRN